MKKNIFLIAILLCLVVFVGCLEEDAPITHSPPVENTNDPEKEISRIECEHENDYMDTINIEGIGHLFINAIPTEFQKEEDVLYIIYNKENNSASFTTKYNFHSYGSYDGRICNLPDFAKEWEISIEGKRIYYEGKLYVSGMYLSEPPHIGGDLILTTFR